MLEVKKINELNPIVVTGAAGSGVTTVVDMISGHFNKLKYRTHKYHLNTIIHEAVANLTGVSVRGVVKDADTPQWLKEAGYSTSNDVVKFLSNSVDEISPILKAHRAIEKAYFYRTMGMVLLCEGVQTNSELEVLLNNGFHIVDVRKTIPTSPTTSSPNITTIENTCSLKELSHKIYDFVNNYTLK